MPKQSVENRNNKRIKLTALMRSRRDKFRKDAINPNLSEKEKADARKKLQTLPRDSSPSRRRNRCKQCSRPRAYNRLTGLCRIHFRIASISGMVPGMHKASW